MKELHRKDASGLKLKMWKQEMQVTLPVSSNMAAQACNKHAREEEKKKKKSHSQLTPTC